MALCDFQTQDFDHSGNQTWGVCQVTAASVESQSDRITTLRLTKGPDRHRGHHAPQRLNRVDGPVDGPHPGRGDPQQPCLLFPGWPPRLGQHFPGKSSPAVRLPEGSNCFHGFIRSHYISEFKGGGGNLL